MRRHQLSTKDWFLSHVSHELRTPLTAIYQFITILSDGLAGELNEQQREYLEIVHRNVKQMQAMVGDLLDAARADKILTNLVCAVVLLPGGQLAKAESATAKLHVSARVVRSCRISPNLLDFGKSHPQAAQEKSEIEVGKGLIINCNTDSRGTMALSVSANLAGNAVIRVISNDNLGGETLKESYLTHGKTNSPAGLINLGLFPTAGAKAILIQSEKPVGSHVTTGTNEGPMTLLINF